MERRLPQVDSDIQRWTKVRQDAIQAIVEANENLLKLGSERNRIMGRIASRHLHVVPNVIELRLVPDCPDDTA